MMRRPFGTLRRSVVAGVLVALAATLTTPAAAAPTPTTEATEAVAENGRARSVTYDRYSLKVDGERILLWGGEFHYFRLPSPALWRDVLEKIRAAGFNGVSLYFSWAYHSPAPGVYDFTGCCG
jgi:hypothetical protein